MYDVFVIFTIMYKARYQGQRNCFRASSLPNRGFENAMNLLREGPASGAIWETTLPGHPQISMTSPRLNFISMGGQVIRTIILIVKIAATERNGRLRVSELLNTTGGVMMYKVDNVDK